MLNEHYKAKKKASTPNDFFDLHRLRQLYSQDPAWKKAVKPVQPRTAQLRPGISSPAFLGHARAAGILTILGIVKIDQR